MRKWHRWLSLFFGVFMLWMAVTGVLSQIVPLTQSRGEGPPAAGAAPASMSKLQPDFVCPADVMCRPKQKGTNIVGLLHHLHSGETFGPVGVVISTLTGFALIFFSVSGIWLYVQMWRFRKDRGLAPKWLWK
nr:PepSY-associated TM helix domain-containing protein [Novosphingobium ovatum]